MGNFCRSNRIPKDVEIKEEDSLPAKGRSTQEMDNMGYNSDDGTERKLIGPVRYELRT